MKKYKEDGWIVARTAGSHGIFDVVAINPIEKCIRFIQVKPTKSVKSWENKLKDFIRLTDEYFVDFKVE